MDGEILVRMEHISKSFPGVKALEDVSLDVKRGKVLALMGENGAGKSTLMKILTGLYRMDTGTVTIDGEKLHNKSINAVLQQGITMIYQELSPVRNMTVAENIYLGREPYRIKGVMVDHLKLNRQTNELLDELGLTDIRAGDSLADMSVAKMQMVEIAKAVSYRSKLIIMDEPTSSISEKECQKLFQIVRRLKKENNISFIFITHKMDEVYQIADEIAVLRDGTMVGTYDAATITQNELVASMVGREITQMFPKLPAEIGEVKLSVRNMNVEGLLEDISFDLHKGEIPGFAGLIGAGRSEVMETLFGLRKMTSGEILIDGKPVKIRNSADAIKNKMAFLTEDRRGTGCFLEQSIRDNLMSCNWDQVIHAGKINYREVEALCNESVDKFAVKTPSLNALIGNLSGGNQQKVLIARWLMSLPEIIIVDEPTRGIDVGSKSEIHRLLSELAQKGHAIIMISSELPEVLGMSDRIVVMYEGKITGILDRDEADQEKILTLASGLTD
ncbi:MAG: sugar ABC transporter ATP-binding protein [Eubacterium sp.]|nr:sugar ABC transporter ATP-binding protein [Eubacterium sp.]